jgi:two-component system response regulator YesN
MRENMTYLRDQFFQELADTYDVSQELISHGKDYGVILEDYCIVAFKSYSLEVPAKRLAFIRDILIKQYPNDYIFRYDKYVLWVSKIVDSHDFTMSKELDGIHEVIEVGLSLYGVNILSGISGVKHGFADFSKREAITALNQSFYSGENICYYNANEPIVNNNFMNEYLEILFDLELKWSGWFFEECVQLISDLFDRLKREHVSAFDTKSIAISIYYICLRTLIKSNLTFPNADFFSEINACQSIDDIQAVVLSCCNESSSLLMSNKKIMNRAVEKAIQYIHSNYKEELSLALIAEEIHINQSHLSRIFKKECGDSITDYIIKIRIEKAQEMLSFSNMLTYEVAEAVGFNDPTYFSTVFKKITGVTPKDFKHMGRK